MRLVKIDFLKLSGLTKVKARAKPEPRHRCLWRGRTGALNAEIGQILKDKSRGPALILRAATAFAREF